jgi:hypothetical protein
MGQQEADRVFRIGKQNPPSGLQFNHHRMAASSIAGANFPLFHRG